MKRRGILWEHMNDKDQWPNEKTAHRKVCDFIAGMTDRYALGLYEHICQKTLDRPVAGFIKLLNYKGVIG